MDHLLHSDIHKFRTIVFGYSLLFRGGFHSTNDFALGCDRWWLTRHPFTPERSKPNAKWFALLKGVWPRCAPELIEDFPFLAQVVDDPLWTVLDWEANAADKAEGFIRRTRVNGTPLLPFSNERMETLCGCPDWTRLAYLVALLRTRDLRYLIHRLWLRKNFSCYVKLVCLTTPCCACSSELYRRLHELYLLGQLGKVDRWPMNLQAFNEALERHKQLWGILERKNWLHEWDAFGVTMLWHVTADLQLITSRLDQGPNDCPRGVLQRVRTTLTKHSETLIKLID